MKPKKKLVRGRDWHAWAWKAKDWGLFFYAEPNRDSNCRPTDAGKWVKVKFVEVK